MSTVTKAISSVEFHVNARQANAALQSMQEEAKKCSEEIDRLQKEAAKGVKMTVVDGQQIDIEKRISQVKSLQKTWKEAIQSQIKGAKAFDELWKNARMGTIESMTGAQIKAGINGSKPIYDRLRLGDAEDRMKAQAIKDMQDQGQKVLNQLKTTTDQIIKQIADGETIAADVLEREARNLKSIMDLLPPLSQEWKDYNLQYQAINQQIERQTVLERQLRGEIVTREDAIRVINAANREATQQEIAQEEQRAKTAREAAEAKAAEADQYRVTVEQKQSEIFATNDLIAAKRREIDAHHESAAAAKDAADKARDAAYKDRKQAEQEARNQQDAYNKQKKIRDDAAKDVEKFRKELEKLGEQDEKRAGVQQKLTDAETRLAEEDRKLGVEQDKLTDKQTKATDAATKHKQAIQGVKDVMEENRKTGQRLGEEMGQLTKQHKQQTEELADASEKMTDAEKESNRHIKTEQEARLRIQQLNNQSIEQLTASLRVLEEENRRINDPGNQRWQENERYIGQLNLRLEELKKQSAELRGEKLAEEAERIAKIVGGDMVSAVQSVTSRVEQATEATRFGISTLDGQIDDVNREMSSLSQHMDEVGNRSTNLMPYVNSITESTKALQEQKAERQEYLNTFQEEAKERAKNIEEQKRQIALMEQERDTQLQTLDQRIKSQQENLEVLKTLHPQTETFSQMSASLEQEIQRLQEEKAALENSEEIKQKLAEANKRLADMIEADAKEIATSETVIAAFDQKIDEIQQSMEKLTHSVPGFDSEELMKYESELSSLTAELQKHQKEREQFIATFEKERAERAQAIEQQKQQIAAIEKEREASINSVNARLEAAQHALAQLRELPDELRGSLPVSDMIQTQLRTIRELQKERFAVATDAEQRLKQANDNLAASIKSDEEATAKAQATIQQYDAQIQKLETDIAQLTQKLSSAKSPLDAKDMEESAKRIGELQAQLKILTEEREKYVALLQRQREEAQDLAEAERAKAVAEKEGMSIEKMEDALKVLEERRRTLAADSPEWEKNEQYIQTLNNRLAEVKQKVAELSGEWMSLEKAMELAKTAGTDQFAGSAKDIQLATAALERQRDTIIATIREKRNLGQATKAEEDQLADLTKKLRSLKFEQDNVNMSQEKMRTLIETPANAVNLDELRAAIKRADGQLRQMQQSLGENSSEYKRFAEQVRNAKNVMKEMEGQAKASATAWEKAFSRLKTYVVMYMGFNEVWQKVSNTARDLMDLSDRMGEVRKTTGFTADEVGRLSEQLKAMDTRSSINDLLSLSAAAGQLGMKNVAQIEGFTEAANQLIVALPEMGRESATALVKISDATGDLEKNNNDVRETLERVGSTIIALRANSASAAPQITDFVSRVGAVGAQAGISIDQIAALGSTVDALGGRVEMSATALSRMIPAIRNNMFGVANAIGVAEQDLKQFIDSGDTMGAMVLIFQKLRESVKQFDASTEEGQAAMADEVERILGKNAAMADVMKQLNQQGARAGIVFGLLSQNVDTLQEQLDVAADAYRENTALMNEYMNMNETTAAKWERLKNQFEELFVSDTMQRGLGVLIDMLRGLVDFITGNVSGALKGLSVTVHTLAFAFLAFKSNIGGLLTSLSRTGKMLGDMKAYMQLAIGDMKEYRKQKLLLAAAHTAEEKAAIKAKLATMGAAKAMRANLFMAAAAAIAAIALQLYNVWKEARKVQDIASEAMANYSREMEQATKKADKMFESVGNARVAVKDANAEVKRAEDGLKAAKKALDEGRGSTEDLEKAETDLKVAHQKVTAANNDHASSIRQLNREYSPYLGYMLSEISTAAELANARELINAKLRETILLKQQEAAYGRVEEEYGEKRDKRQKSVYDLVAENVTDPEAAAQMRKDIMELVKQAKDGSKGILDIRKEWARIHKASGVTFSVTDYQGMESYIWRLVETEREIQDAKKIIDDNIAADIKVARTGTRDKKGNIVTKGTQQELQDQLDAIYKGDEGMENGLLQLEAKYKAADDKTRKKRAADLLQQMDAYEKLLANSKNFYDLQDNKETESYKTLLANGDKRMKGLRAQRDELLKAAGDAYKAIQETDDKRGGGGSGTRTTNPYGQYDRVTDPYSKWNGDDLVARRKEMLVRVRALANGADVQKVLSEDAKFISEAVRKNIKTTEQAIEWYNAERLKIQEALYNKHLTPTGDWLDPKKGAGNWRKQLQTDFDNYLRILDAYYTERKAHIEKAQAEEGLSEAEAQRLTVENETVWRKHRMELQQIYLGKSADIAEEERQRIYDILAEQDEDSADMVEKQIAISINKLHLLAQKSEVEARKIETKLVKDIATDHYKQQNAVSKQMEAIEKIISEERPFDGITKNLRDNLSTMGVLFADFDKKRREAIERGEQPEDDMAERAKQMAKRLSVVLDGVPDAYRMTFDQLKEVMIKEGFGEWAKAIEGDEQLKLAMMAQIRKTYDQVQEAIRKEAAIIKKHADNLWNDALTPDGKSMKNQFEAAISQLGLQADQVKRANSLIGAGVASDRVADRLVIQQMKVQLAMERARFALMHKIGEERIRQEQAVEESLRRQGKLEEAKRKHADIENMQKSLGLAISEEQKKVDEQRVAIQNQLEESQNRLYTELREWADLLTSSLQGVFEASHAGDAEYYNERAKLDLTGKGGPGAGTYVVIDDAGTSDAKAHYEYLDERQALERQHEIEIQNAQAEAWRKLMDDINMKMSEQITDWMNSALQSQSIDANTQAVIANTQALWAQLGQDASTDFTDASQLKRDENGFALDGSGQIIAPIQPTEPAQTEQPTSYWPIGDTEQKPMWTATDPANTAATDANTQAVNALTQALGGQAPAASAPADVPAAPAPAPAPAGGEAADAVFLQKPMFLMTEEEKAQAMTAIGELWQAYNEGGVAAMTEMAASLAEIPGVVLPPWQIREDELEAVMERMGTLWQSYAEQGIAAMQQMSDAMEEMPNKIPDPTGLTEERIEKAGESLAALGQKEIDMSNLVTQKKVENKQKEVKSQKDGNKQEETSTQSSFAKMAAAANMYGLAYQAMSNDNLSTAQKFQVFALQAAGQAAIAMLTTDLFQAEADQMVKMPGILGKLLGEMPYPAAIATYAGITALMGGLMGLAASQVSKSKSQIAQATGASVGAGRLATGMLTYAEGNVNELTDPALLTPGRQYNVDGADGKTYRAKYMGKGAKTHITNGPEFHLVGEAGREAIIDAKTTRLLQLNETGIWRDIQTLYNGGSISGLSTRRRRGTGVAAFADGNVGEFEEDGGSAAVYGTEGAGGFGAEQMAAFQSSLDKNNELLERALANGIKAVYGVYGPDGIVNAYDTGKKNLQRYGVKH